MEQIQIKATEIILKIKKDLLKKGLNYEVLVEDLKQLRPSYIELKDPLITKVIRLTYEHIEKYNKFHIPLPEDEITDEEGNVIETEKATEEGVDTELESVDFLLSLFLKADNKMNRAEITTYRDKLMALE